jgi:NTP pyrophosphatase (non-canonical NTP hydrolase)
MQEIKMTVHPFRMGTDKAAAVKVLEEAAEAYGIWDGLNKQDNDPDLLPFLADEIADVIQAACNLADRYDIDMAAAMGRCEQRNRDRGRYEW